MRCAGVEVLETLHYTRSRCSTCQKIAPSQAKVPPVEPLVPNYPFEHVCVYYMSLNGHQFQMFVDRYTEWPGVVKCEGFDQPGHDRRVEEATL